MSWSQSDIITHPAMDLTLKQLQYERRLAIEHNKKVNNHNYQFKKMGVYPVSIEAIDKFIRLKEDGQLRLF